MGSAIEITCRNCDYSFEGDIGIGTRYSELQVVVPLLHHARIKIVDDILDNHDVEETDYGHKIYRCGKCFRFFERFHVRIEYDSGRVFETEFKCSKCRKVLDGMDVDADVFNPENEFLKRLSGLSCPECGKTSLFIFSISMWD